MKDVYGNSMLNIAAAAAAESSEPSFQSRDPYFIYPPRFDAQWQQDEDAQPGTAFNTSYYIVDEDIFEKDVQSSPLYQRAWVMQEVWLARRNLNLTANQLWWQCSELTACESYPHGLPSPWAGIAGRMRALNPSDDREVMYQAWLKLAERYSNCLLTYPSDRIIAYAGIVQHFQRLLPHDDKYIAGMWRSQLPWSLVWSTHKTRPCYRPDGYRAPSWAWMSVEGPVLLESKPPALAESDTLMTPCTVIDVTVETDDGTNGTGTIIGGYIRIKAPLTRVGVLDDSLSLETSPGEWEYIPGTDEGVGQPYRRDTWTAADFDESTPDGDPALSFLEPITETTLARNCHDMQTIPRVRQSFETNSDPCTTGHDYHLFALPIMKWAQAGKPFCEGSILLSKPGWPIHIYQKVGAFTASGDIAIGALERRREEHVITIL